MQHNGEEHCYRVCFMQRIFICQEKKLLFNSSQRAIRGIRPLQRGSIPPNLLARRHQFWYYVQTLTTVKYSSSKGQTKCLTAPRRAPPEAIIFTLFLTGRVGLGWPAPDGTGELTTPSRRDHCLQDTFIKTEPIHMNTNRAPELLRIGEIGVTWLQGGFFHLDGGTMFGPVPKILWQKKFTVDENNLIPMCNDPILVRAPGMNILIDTGLGNKLDQKQRSLFHVTSEWDLPARLEAHGLSRNDIDTVILTHCDFDHAGGILMHNESGGKELTFPRAVHIINRREWEDVKNPDRRAQSTYLPENFDLLATSGQIELTDGGKTICPGVTIFHSGGHTRGHQIVEMQSRGKTAVHLGDLCPTHAHFNPLWVMAYDNFPLEVIARKEDYLARYRKADSWFLLYHDPFVRACKLGPDGKPAETW